MIYSLGVRMLQLILAFVTVVAVAPKAAAQVDASPHAWIVIDDPVEFTPRGQGGDGMDPDGGPSSETDASDAEPSQPASVLLHVPPRIPLAGASPAPDLRVARVARLAIAPQWLVPV
ncbi:MAG: hypothetical protein AAFY46_07180, partial [Planctomycetota bacterium]